NNRIPIRSVYPVGLTYNAHDEKTYGLWVTHSRTDFDDAYKIHIAEYTGNGENLQFGENLLMSSRVQFQTTTKPTLHCGGIAASNICTLFYIPLENKMNYLHFITLTRELDSFDIPPNAQPFQVIIDGSPYPTGSTLTSWAQPGDP